MNFIYRKGLIWISVTIIYEGKEIVVNDCILDTGSATTAIDIDLLTINYSIPSKIKRLFGVGGGTQDVISQNIDAIKIGETIIPNIEMEFGDLKGRLGINGFIGNDILCHFSVCIEYPKNILLLLPPI